MMHSDLFTCSVCCFQFDRSTYLPKVIPSCGHTLCLSCITAILKNLKQCPLDRTNFSNNFQRSEQFPTNHLILQLIDENLNAEHGACNKHGKSKHLVCVDDRTQICQECVSSHKGHLIKTVTEIKDEAASKKQKLEAIINEFQNQRNKVEPFLTDSKKTLCTALKQEFGQAKEAIQKKEKEILFGVEVLFESKKLEIYKALERDNILYQKYEDKIADLDNLGNKRFFTTLKKLDKTMSVFEINEHLQTIKGIEDKLIQTVKGFSSLLISTLENIEITDIKDLPALCNDNPSDFSNLFEIKVQRNLISISPKHDSEIYLGPKTSLPDASLLKEIKTFEVNFDKGKPTGQHLQALKHIYSHCEKINQLNLFLNNQHISDEDLALFSFDPFWSRDKIEVFFLSLSQARISDSGVIRLIANSFTEMSSLQSFDLHLVETKITDQTIQVLASSLIANCVNLSQFCLSIGKTGVTDLGIIELCKCLRPISKNLTSFTLGLRDTQITDKSIIAFAQENLSMMTNLETFKLYVSKTQVTDKGFLVFCEHAARAFQHTKRLFLNLGWTQVTDKSGVIFGKNVLSNMRSIQEISVYFTSTKITDLSFKNVFLGFEKVGKSLKSVTLSFSSTNISDAGVQELSQPFRTLLKHLEYFNLQIGDSGVTEKGIEMMINQVDLPTVVNLNTFDVVFTGILVNQQIKTKLSQIKQQLSLRQTKTSSIV